jgi:hypothetical protein
MKNLLQIYYLRDRIYYRFACFSWMERASALSSA